METLLSRRALLGGVVTGVAAVAVDAGAADAARGRQVLIATNEPWGTYHVKPLLAEADRRGWRLTQLVPDRSQVTPGDPVPVATLADAPRADLLVVTGAGDWPAECVARLGRMPVAASSLAYQQPVEAPRAKEIRPRLRLITSSAPAEGRAFGGHLGTRRHVRIVGSPQTDVLPQRAPEKDLVLVLTSVTHPDSTGSAAPGTKLLLDATEKLAAAGKRILVGLHPREDRRLWDSYEISSVSSVMASARAEAAIGIPGTVFPLIAAVGTPIVGCTDPALSVPEYLRAVCSSTIADAAQAVTAVAGARLPSPATLADAVGPIGGSARRLLNEWAKVARHPR
ncbi:hypothetical protein [Allokutzneria oryzae]|uniref:Uncharacterized protein n=1 Tax=Allokutzneria oryzae TaxID=1378989 RepID=A0ABV6AAY3_9PSEU